MSLNFTALKDLRLQLNLYDNANNSQIIHRIKY